MADYDGVARPVAGEWIDRSQLEDMAAAMLPADLRDMYVRIERGSTRLSIEFFPLERPFGGRRWLISIPAREVGRYTSATEFLQGAGVLDAIAIMARAARRDR